MERSAAIATKSGAKVLAAFVGIILVVPMAWFMAVSYIDQTSLATTGTVIAKQERILLGRGDSWYRLFEITYRYQPAGAAYPEAASQNVDFGLYNRVQVGTTLPVRYSRWKFIRLLQGIGSHIERTSATSRLRYGSIQASDLAALAAVVLAGVFGLIAYSKRNMALGAAGALVLGVAFPSILLVATSMLVFPMLFWAWRRRPGEGFGWMLVGSIGVLLLVTYLRVPHPTPMPSGPRQSTIAIVHRLKTVREIWISGPPGTATRRSGEMLSRPFYIADLEFTPAGASDPVHAVDKFDIESMPGLRQGAAVPISYSVDNPRIAQLTGATRTYDQSALQHLLAITFGGGAIFTFVLVPILHGLDKLFAPYKRLVDTAAAVSHEQLEHELAISPFERIQEYIVTLPPDDPRRQKFEARLREWKSTTRGQN